MGGVDDANRGPNRVTLLVLMLGQSLLGLLLSDQYRDVEWINDLDPISWTV